VIVVAGNAPFHYQWQVEDSTASGGWANLVDGPILLGGLLTCGTASGAHEPTMIIDFTCPSGPSRVRCAVSNPCGSVTSDTASLTLCPPDFNCSGVLGVQDIFDFLAAYFNGEFRADFNGSGNVSVQDIFNFLAAYFAGCS
jgi:hypothetical protein